MASQLAWVKNIGSDEPPNHHEQSRRVDLRRRGGPGQGKGRTNDELRMTNDKRNSKKATLFSYSSFFIRHSSFFFIVIPRGRAPGRPCAPAPRSARQCCRSCSRRCCARGNTRR